jgi:hypothetical protein
MSEDIEKLREKADKARHFWMQNQVLLMHINDLERRLAANQRILKSLVVTLTDQGALALEKINFDIFEVPARPHLALDARAVRMKELR